MCLFQHNFGATSKNLYCKFFQNTSTANYETGVFEILVELVYIHVDCTRNARLHTNPYFDIYSCHSIFRDFVEFVQRKRKESQFYCSFLCINRKIYKFLSIISIILAIYIRIYSNSALFG